jgi:hypothetical protein
MKYLDCQKYMECQLVTAINCYTYLTGRTIDQNSKRYESLVDLIGARHGSAITIEKAHKRLGIKPINHYHNRYDFLRDLKIGKNILPVETNIYDKRYGNHSVAIVDFEPKTECFLVPNFRVRTSLGGWIFAEDLDIYISCHQALNENHFNYEYRVFGLARKEMSHEN